MLCLQCDLSLARPATRQRETQFGEADDRQATQRRSCRAKLMPGAFLQEEPELFLRWSYYEYFRVCPHEHFLSQCSLFREIREIRGHAFLRVSVANDAFLLILMDQNV